MPTEKELQEKIKIYNKELENVKNQLTAKRIELSTLSKTKLEDLQKEIPKLEDDIFRKKAIINELDREMNKKKAEVILEKESCKKNYEDLEKKLKAEHYANTVYLNNKQTEVNKLKDEYNLKSNELNKKESRLAEDKKSLSDRELVVKNYEETLNNKYKQFKKDTEIINAGLTRKNDELSAAIANVNNQKIELSKKEKFIISKEEAANNVLKRIRDAEEILENAKLKEKQNINREELLNQENVRIRSEIVKMNRRESELNRREEQLNIRENNLKILEAKI